MEKRDFKTSLYIDKEKYKKLKSISLEQDISITTLLNNIIDEFLNKGGDK